MNVRNELEKGVQSILGGIGQQIKDVTNHIGPAVVAEVLVERTMGKKQTTQTVPQSGKGASVATAIADSVGVGSDITGLRKKLLYIVYNKLEDNLIGLFEAKYDQYKNNGKENKFVTVLAEAIGASNETIPDDDKIPYLEDICLMDDERFYRWLNASDHDPVAEKAKYAIRETTKILEDGANMFRDMRNGSRSAQKKDKKPGFFSRVGKRFKDES